jgi:hypothetical protein
MKITKSELREMIREALREALNEHKPAPRLKESVWTCFFDDREVGTVEAATEYDAKVKMMDKYPEYPYGLYDGCFWVEPLTEGIFDSKETKQKAYAKIIADAFDKKAPAAIVSQIASLAERALSETMDSFDETNVSSAKTAVKNFIIAIEAAKTNAKKTPYGILNSIISHVQKYNRNAMGLDELVEFKRTALYVQSHEKDGQKAMYYLMELLNKHLVTRLDKTVAFLKKEYSI